MKIILADDEQMLRLGMISMIEELEPKGFTILQARNGKELLALAQQEHPEIAYIDIKMPVMDGLEAFRQMKSVSPETQCFILTGYAEFEYVQSAIHHGALDYLLKPITLEALRASLDRALERLQNSWKQANLEFNAMIARLFGSVSTQPSVDIHEQNLCSPFNITLIYTSKKTNPQAMSHCRYQYEHRMKALHSSHYALYRPFADKTLCMITEKKDAAAEECLTAFRHALLASGCNVFSADVQHLQEIPACASDLEKRAALRFLTASGESLPSHIPESQQLSLFCHTLYKTISALEENNHFQFDGWMARLEGIQTYKFENQLYLQSLKQHFDCLASARNIAMIPPLLRQAGERQFAPCHDKADLPEAVKAYIDTNYHMDIGTSIIADTFSISPNYLSSIFKKKYQIGLLAYLTQVRMAKAKLLIQKEPNIPIQKVAAAVGYSNPGYFSKVFQKTFGVLPSDFH